MTCRESRVYAAPQQTTYACCSVAKPVLHCPKRFYKKSVLRKCVYSAVVPSSVEFISTFQKSLWDQSLLRKFCLKSKRDK